MANASVHPCFFCVKNMSTSTRQGYVRGVLESPTAPASLERLLIMFFRIARIREIARRCASMNHHAVEDSFRSGVLDVERCRDFARSVVKNDGGNVFFCQTNLRDAMNSTLGLLLPCPLHPETLIYADKLTPHLARPSLYSPSSALVAATVPRRSWFLDQPRPAIQHVREQPAAGQPQAHSPLLGLHDRVFVYWTGRWEAPGRHVRLPDQDTAVAGVLVWYHRPSDSNGAFTGVEISADKGCVKHCLDR